MSIPQNHAGPELLIAETSYRDAIIGRLSRDPEHIVIHDRSGPITASGFLNRVGLILEWLQPLLAAEPQSQRRPVGLMFHDNVWTIAAMIACWHLRVPPLLLDHRLSPKDLDAWTARCDLSLIVTQQNRLIDIANVNYIGDPNKFLSESSRIAGGRALLNSLTRAAADPEDIAEYMTSSGVSGPPKLYPIPQKDLLRNTLASARNGLRGAWGRALCPISVVFGGARMIWWRNLLSGVPIHNFPLLFSTSELDRALQRDEVEECTLPPYLIRALVDLARRTPGTVPRYPNLIKLQSVGGPALPEDKINAQQLLSSAYVMTYSSTETGVVARIEGEDLRARPASCGRPLPPGRLEIVNADGAPLPTGTVGRIRLTWPVPEGAAADHPPSHAWPGDEGWLDDEGFLYITGRGDGIICRNGVSFSSAMLESKVLECPEVLDAAVVRMPRDEGDDDFVIAVVGRNGVTEGQINLALRKILSSHEQPTKIVKVERRDITPGGKLARSALASRLTTDNDPVTAPAGRE